MNNPHTEWQYRYSNDLSALVGSLPLDEFRTQLNLNKGVLGAKWSDVVQGTVYLQLIPYTRTLRESPQLRIYGAEYIRSRRRTQNVLRICVMQDIPSVWWFWTKGIVDAIALPEPSWDAWSRFSSEFLSLEATALVISEDTPAGRAYFEKAARIIAPTTPVRHLLLKSESSFFSVELIRTVRETARTLN